MGKGVSFTQLFSWLNSDVTKACGLDRWTWSVTVENARTLRGAYPEHLRMLKGCKSKTVTFLGKGFFSGRDFTCRAECRLRYVRLHDLNVPYR